MSSCGNCGGCSGCDRSLTMTEPELEVLTALAQIPFLPIGRRMDDAAPVALKNADYSRYAHLPIHGSMALTARGQQVLEVLERQGTV